MGKRSDRATERQSDRGMEGFGSAGQASGRAGGQKGGPKRSSSTRLSDAEVEAQPEKVQSLVAWWHGGAKVW